MTKRTWPKAVMTFEDLLIPLTRKQRAAMKLRIEGGFTYQQIGEHLGISAQAAHRLIKRAREFINLDDLKQAGEDLLGEYKPGMKRWKKDNSRDPGPPVLAGQRLYAGGDDEN